MGHRPTYEHRKFVLSPKLDNLAPLTVTRAKLKARADSIPNFQRHSRKCQICNHPERKAIENDFFDWKRANWIAQRYELHGKSTIYRHARATALDVRRRENLSRRAEEILDKVSVIEKPSVSLVLHAVRTLASLNERGQRVKPPVTHGVVSTTTPPAFSCPTSTPKAVRRASPRLPMEMISNRHTREKLELGVTHSKQTSGATSNRHN